MYPEIYTAVSFLSGFLYNKLPRRKVNLFSAQLANDLVVRFTPTWNTDEPHKGVELRKLNVKARGVVDTLISVTALNVGLNLEEVLQQFPDELTVWVDPGEVTFRLGERGQATVIYNAADPSSVTLNRMLTQNLTSNADGTGLRVNFAPALWNNAQPLTSTPLNSIAHSSSISNNGSTVVNNDHCLPAFELTSPNDVQFTVGSFAMTRFGTTKVKNMPTALSRLRQKQRSRGITESHFRSLAAAPTSHSSTPPPYISNGQLFSNSQQSIPAPATPNVVQRPFSAIPFNLAPGSSPRDTFLASFSTNALCANNSAISSARNNSSPSSGGSLSSSYFDQSVFGINSGADSLFSGLGGPKLYKTSVSGGHSVDSSSSPNSSSTPGSSNNNRESGGGATSSHSGYTSGFSDPTSSPASTSDIATTLFGLPPIRRQSSWNLGF